MVSIIRRDPTHLVEHILQTWPVVARKHDQDDVRVVVAQRPETVKVFLSCRVP